MASNVGEMCEDAGSSGLALGEMAMGFFRGKVLCAAVRLGIADALAAGPMTAEELAVVTMTDPDALRRFLRALASIGVVAVSQLLLIEVVLPNRVERPSPEIEKLFMSDLNMLVVTGGRERSEDEWHALLAMAGLVQRRILPVPGQAASIIEAAPRDGQRTRAAPADAPRS